MDASTCTCRVYAFKEGLLSAVGHDVRLRVERFEITRDGDEVEATFEAASLRAECAMRGGVEDRAALSDKDRQTIDGYVANDILAARRHPRVAFRSTSADLHGLAEDGGEGTVEGTLTLAGRSRGVVVRVIREGAELVARARIHQPDFGIAPFKAMLGALRIKPHVDVELRLPADGR